MLEQVASLRATKQNGAADRVRLVEITGGEPLLQPETPALARRLLGEGYMVLIETSGERFVERAAARGGEDLDVKCPDSGECGTFRPCESGSAGQEG